MYGAWDCADCLLLRGEFVVGLRGTQAQQFGGDANYCHPEWNTVFGA
jgi:hypothetical protein